jgi:RND superfamily putative drug exporter
MMVGLGVGIDYALFIVTRHRQHLHEGMKSRTRRGLQTPLPGRPCCSPAPPS